MSTLFTLTIFCFHPDLVAAEKVDKLKDSHRPALNYPQSVEWAKKRDIDSLYAFRASDVLGQTVYNGEGTEIGEVDDIIIPGDASSEPLKVIIEVGGFLGIGETLVAIPYDQLRVSKSGREGVYYNATEKQLLSIEAFAYGSGEQTGKNTLRSGAK